VTMLPGTLRKPLLDHVGAHEGAARIGPYRWARERGPPRGAPGQVPQRPCGMGVAVGLSRDAVLRRPANRRATAASPPRVRPTAGRKGRSPGGRHFASSHVPFAQA
jgi:hypothetical protein